MDLLMDEREEQKLIARVLRGEREVFSQLVEHYGGTVYNLAYRMTGCLQEAEDVAQEVFLQAYRSLWRYDPRKRFFTWVYTIALNILRNRLKSQDRRRQRDNEGIVDAVPCAETSTPEALYLQREEDDLLDSSLHQLPQEMREVLVLRYYQGLSFAEMAAILSTSESAVKMRTYRALERLRNIINKG
ncbi:MAG: RNA polymerase sigma factor [Syntrophales bacterium]|nr:RNA polymerase sigma factor [Syntrophales bacterium]